MDSTLASSTMEERAGFWGRQFRASPTPGQFIFDIVFGILMPVLCFYFDPGIIRGQLLTPLRSVSIFVYGFSGLAIGVLTLWLVLGDRGPSWSAGFSGVLLAGAVLSFSIGIVILPMTLIGILIVIGLLGFVPFVTGFVYLRNSLRAIKCARTPAGRPRVAVIALSAILATGLVGFAQREIHNTVEKSMATILSGDAGSVNAAVQRMKHLHWIIDADRLVRAYERETDAARKERLGNAYKEITGDEIETRLRILD